MTADTMNRDASLAHAPLVQRLAIILESLSLPGVAHICDARQNPGAVQSAVVGLTRSKDQSMTRQGLRQWGVSYADPLNEAALAAVLATAIPAMGPIAADTESLSVLALAERLAPTTIPVLINGPTGTGKEVLSRYIHFKSARAKGPFIAVNCAAMPETMLEAMLFGHQKGAFTGATQSSEGFFRAADGGTLLLDEIAEMPLALQAKLLRALQEGEVVPIGATSPIKVDVRIIACANRDLPLEVESGRFRADLYYRLNVFPLTLLPLRERPADIAPLAFAMAIRHSDSAATSVPWVGDAALAMLRQHPWPGNVRELENVIRRALLLVGQGQQIEASHIIFDRPARLVASQQTDEQHSSQTSRNLSNIVQISEAKAILETLAACGGSRIAAARELGISERTLRYRLASFREAGLAVAGGRS